MALNFNIHTIPSEMMVAPKVNEDERIKISKRLEKTNRKLLSRMKVIQRREKKSWQMNLVRN